MEDNIGTVKIYKLPADEFLAKHDPCRIGHNTVGWWYEHPIYGDEAGLLVLPTGTNKVHLTDWVDVPTDEDVGVTFTRA